MITIDGQVYDGVNDKPPLDEFIEHRDHKYISKYMGKNGKWIYTYKSKAQELGAKIDRKIKGIDDNQVSRTDYWDYSNPNKPRVIGKTSRYVMGKDSGKANSRSGQTGSRFNSGIEAGRKRAAKKGYAVKGYRGKTGSNLSSRGYSNSNSPKGYETWGKTKVPRYDQPSKAWEFFAGKDYYIQGKNDAQVAKGTYAGRKRMTKKKKK